MGELGFWLMVGMVIAASIVSDGLKARDKEREKQATLRALLEKEGQSATEVLAYMREKDAARDAEAARDRATERRQWRKLAAATTGILALGGGIVAFAAVGELMKSSESGSVLIPLTLLLAIWAAGLVVAIRMWRSANQKHDAHPDA